MSDRIRAIDVAKMTGLSLRMIQKRAKLGDIPGAAQLCGIWTFDQGAVQRWIAQKERETAERGVGKRDSKPEVASSWSWGREKEIDEAYRRLLRWRPAKPTQDAPKKSRNRAAKPADSSR